MKTTITPNQVAPSVAVKYTELIKKHFGINKKNAEHFGALVPTYIPNDIEELICDIGKEIKHYTLLERTNIIHNLVQPWALETLIKFIPAPQNKLPYKMLPKFLKTNTGPTAEILKYFSDTLEDQRAKALFKKYGQGIAVIPGDSYDKTKISETITGIVNGMTLLNSIKSENWNAEAIKDFLQNHSNASLNVRDVRDEWDETILHHLASSGDCEAIKVLLSHRANLNIGNAIKRTPLHFAIKSGNTEVVRILLDAGADTKITLAGNTYLHFAIYRDKVEIVDMLIQAGLGVNAQNLDAATPLHRAVRSYTEGDDVAKKIVLTLLKNGADLEMPNIEGDTALHLAAQKTSGGCILNILLEKGANLNAVNNNNKTPLQLVSEDFLTWHKVMIVYNIKQDQSESKALHRAICNKDSKAVKALLKAGVDVDAQTDDGYTALHLAVCNHDDNTKEIVDILLEYRANLEVADKAGRTPLHLAVQMQMHCPFKQNNVLDALLECGAKVSNDVINAEFHHVRRELEPSQDTNLRRKLLKFQIKQNKIHQKQSNSNKEDEVSLLGKTSKKDDNNLEPATKKQKISDDSNFDNGTNLHLHPIQLPQDTQEPNMQPNLLGHSDDNIGDIN